MHGEIAKRLNAADCKSAPSGSGVRIPLSPLNRIQRTLRNPYENRKLTQCAKHTRKFIFFTRILVRVQLGYEAVKTPSEIGLFHPAFRLSSFKIRENFWFTEISVEN